MRTRGSNSLLVRYFVNENRLTEKSKDLKWSRQLTDATAESLQAANRNFRRPPQRPMRTTAPNPRGYITGSNSATWWNRFHIDVPMALATPCQQLISSTKGLFLDHFIWCISSCASSWGNHSTHVDVLTNVLRRNALRNNPNHTMDVTTHTWLTRK